MEVRKYLNQQLKSFFLTIRYFHLIYHLAGNDIMDIGHKLILLAESNF